jgi:hypothetical protein
MVPGATRQAAAAADASGILKENLRKMEGKRIGI